MKEQPVYFSIDGLKLEGLVHVVSDSTWGVVVCHPHPLYGGTMYNNVVEGLVNTMIDAQFSCLRFNFRGVGKSEGSHGGGVAEQSDVEAALACLEEKSNCQKLAVCGYSFGAAIGGEVGYRDPRVAAIGLWALPITLINTSLLLTCKKPKFMIAGSQDKLATAQSIEGLFEKLPQPKEYFLIEGADHFFAGKEKEGSVAFVEFLKGLGFGS